MGRLADQFDADLRAANPPTGPMTAMLDTDLRAANAPTGPISLQELASSVGGLAPAAPAGGVSLADLAASAPTAAPSVPDMPTSSGLDNFTSALLHHLGNALHGTAQLVEHGIAKGADLIDPNYGGNNLGSAITGQPTRSGWNRALQADVTSDDAALARRETAYQASTPDNPASYAGAAAGEVAPFLVGGVANAVKGVGDVAGNLASKGLSAISAKVPAWLDWTIPRVAQGAAQGGAIAASQPVTDPSNYWGAKGSQMGVGSASGAAIPLIGGPTGWLWNQVKGTAAPFVNPSGLVADWAQQQARAAGVNPADLAAQLRSAPQIVPGSTPTTAQAAPLPFLVQSEKMLANNPEAKGRLAGIQASNNQARWAQLNGVAGQPGALEQATADRAAAADAAYSRAYANGPDPSLTTPKAAEAWSELQQRPAIQRAFAQGRQYLQNKGIQLPTGNEVQDPHVVMLADYAKKSLDSDISQGIRSGADVSDLRSARTGLVNAIDSISPDYAAARKLYASASPPIESMQAATDIAGKLSGQSVTTAAPGQMTGAPLITLQRYRTLLGQAINGSDYGIQPDALAKLQAIQNDLQRESGSDAIRISGSPTAYNLQAPGWLASKLYGADFTGSNVGPRVLGGVLGAAGGSIFGGLGAGGGAWAGQAAGMNLARAANQRVMGALADATADPNAMAGLLMLRRSPNPTGAQAQRLLQAMRGGLLSSTASVGSPDVLTQVQNYPR